VVWADDTLGKPDIYYAAKSSVGSWSSPVNISNTSAWSWEPQLAIDSSDTLHLVWREDEDDREVYYAMKSRGDSWSTPVNISNNRGTSEQAELCIDSFDTVHLVWVDCTPGNCEIYYAAKPAGGSWSSPINISNTASGSGAPKVAVDWFGIVHVVWYEHLSDANDDIYYTAKPTGGSWSAPVNISDSPAHNSVSPDIVIDSSGTVHVVWEEWGKWDIYYVAKPRGGSWTAPVNISNSPGTFSDEFYMCLDGSDTVHVTWEEGPWGNAELYYASRRAGASWSSPVNVSRTPAQSWSGPIVVDGAGVAHVVWADKITGGADIYYASKPDGAPWSSPVNISMSPQYAYAPRLAIDNNNSVHVVWLGYIPQKLDSKYCETLTSSGT